MLWIISIALFIWCLILEHELLKIKKIKNVLFDSNSEKDEALKNLQDSCDYFQREGNKWFHQRNTALEQAKAFQSVAKTMEEHLAAERSRADRLEAALLKMKEESQQASKPDGLSKEWANIFAYNGTGDGQEDV